MRRTSRWSGRGGAVATFAPETQGVVSSPLGTGRTDLVWFAVQTWPRYEKKVAAELESKAVTVFLPLLRDKHKWSDRTRIVESPLFPSYVFARVQPAPEARIPILRTNGVISFVGTCGVGTPIPAREIESVRTLLHRGISFHTHPFLTVGQRVRIRSGSLQGVEGVLVGKDDEDPSLVVSIQIIQRSVAVRLHGYQIEAA